MKITSQHFIDTINEYANDNKLFWVCACARDCLDVLKNHMDELHPDAKMAVEHYLEERNKNGH